MVPRLVRGIEVSLCIEKFIFTVSVMKEPGMMAYIVKDEV